MAVDFGKLGQQNLSTLKEVGIGTGVDVIANAMGSPLRSVGYGQTPYIPIDSKLEQWNRYIMTIAQAVAGLNATTGAANATLQNIMDRIDLPVSSRLMMFRPLDKANPSWKFPVLVLPVNPDSFKVDYKKKSDLVYTLGGFVVTHWHDDAISISANGFIPSFKNKAKVLTSSYQYFMQFLQLYLNCGKIQSQPQTFQTAIDLTSQDLIGSQLSSKLTQQGVDGNFNANVANTKQIKVTTTNLQNAIIELRYQQDVYEGIFLSFSIEESYEMPNTLQYSFTFKALHRKDVAFGSLSDNQNPVDFLLGENGTSTDIANFVGRDNLTKLR